MRYGASEWERAKALVFFRIYGDVRGMRVGIARFQRAKGFSVIRNVNGVGGYIFFQSGSKGWWVYDIFLHEGNVRSSPRNVVHEICHMVSDVGERRGFARGGELECDEVGALYESFWKWERRSRKRRKEKRDGVHGTDG